MSGQEEGNKNSWVTSAESNMYGTLFTHWILCSGEVKKNNLS